MAVQQNKKSPSRRGMRRGHDTLTKAELSIDKSSGARHIRHHISSDGYYRGRRVLSPKPEETKEE